MGTAGQTKTKDIADAATAQKDHDNLVAETTKKGYKEVTKGAAAAAPAPAKAAAPAPAPAKEEKPATKTTTKAKKEDAAPAKAAAPAPAPAKAGGKRRFEFSEGSSNKFWEIEL